MPWSFSIDFESDSILATKRSQKLLRLFNFSILWMKLKKTCIFSASREAPSPTGEGARVVLRVGGLVSFSPTGVLITLTAGYIRICIHLPMQSPSIYVAWRFTARMSTRYESPNRTLHELSFCRAPRAYHLFLRES